MRKTTIMVTGSSGLIGSEVALYFGKLGCHIHGVDNNQREVFFGPQGNTRWRLEELRNSITTFTHHELDIRNRAKVLDLLAVIMPDAIIHAAAQPSHDKAASIPFEDFDVNAVGTLNLLESARQNCPESPFVHMSTNKVYGDGPNHIRMKEKETRWEFDDPEFNNGISESFSIDQCKHSLFGASKLSADIMVQEYGRYFGMPTCCLRGGCLTGPAHSGVELHGFLSYLIKCNLQQITYKVYGYKGKQLRDNIHSADVTRLIQLIINNPRVGEVYNLGGGKENTCSILEAFSTCKEFTKKSQIFEYDEKHRIGDHKCYYSDLSKIKLHYPEWDISYNLTETIGQIVKSWRSR